jgi:dihydropteroate synthase
MRSICSWRLSRAAISLGHRTVIMGILNVTPDSFSDGGLYSNRESAIARAKEIEQEGAGIIDIGGESTRPGSEAISEQEEMRRVLPVIESVVRTVTIPISIDTYRASVARRAVEAGAQIVNDISGFRFDDGMPLVVKESSAGVVLMHSRGNRETLHRQSRMEDPIQEVTDGLSESLRRARAASIPTAAVVIDPGIGFGKTADESLRVLKDLIVFSKLELPLLVGTSRKSFIHSAGHERSESKPDAKRKRDSAQPQDRAQPSIDEQSESKRDSGQPSTRLASTESNDAGTAATIVAAIMNGAHIVRVHNVRQARALADMTDRILLA